MKRKKEKLRKIIKRLDTTHIGIKKTLCLVN